MDRCLASVRDWAEQAGYGYQFMGDELFEFVPSWYLTKCGEKLPVATDLARLIWMQQCLQEKVADCVLWMDAGCTGVCAPAAHCAAVQLSIWL